MLDFVYKSIFPSTKLSQEHVLFAENTKFIVSVYDPTAFFGMHSHCHC